MPEKPPRMIRFIDSQYNDKFYIPDGARIHIELPDRNWSAKCEFIDPYHTEIGGNIFHMSREKKLPGNPAPVIEKLYARYGYKGIDSMEKIQHLQLSSQFFSNNVHYLGAKWLFP